MDTFCGIYDLRYVGGRCVSGERRPDAMHLDRYCLLCDTQIACRCNVLPTVGQGVGATALSPRAVGNRVTNESLDHICILPACNTRSHWIFGTSSVSESGQMITVHSVCHAAM